ncbi:MAG: PEP-CTERM sorting domain-containing protein [Verrucomicrobiales bacterium]|nr:PEP-CTERM sorting domain-containing protein [Verrucomicrobiales bacterium]
MEHTRTIQTVICGLLFIATVAPASLIDPLDDPSNFGTPLNSTLTSSLAGELSLISDVPSVDRLVDWQINGSTSTPTRLDLVDEGYVTVTPTNQINSGEWGLWAVYYNSSGTFVDEINILPYTSSADVVSVNVTTSAPVTADDYILRFRVTEAAGDGFSFTQIDATPTSAIPEPASFLLLTPILLGIFLRRRIRNQRG